MDISPTGQRVLIYLYTSIFVEADQWGYADPAINGIDCKRWATEKGIDAQDLITTLEDLYAAGFIRVLLFDGAVDAGLLPYGIEVVEARGLAAPDVIASQKAVRFKMLDTLATHRQESLKGMRTTDLEKATGIPRFALDNNGWYLDRIGFINQSENHLKITDKGVAEASPSQSTGS